MDWRSVEAAREPASSVAASELRPSIRDFTQHLGAGRRTLGVIPLLVGRNVGGGDEVAVGLARALDELDVPALAVATAPGVGRLAALTAVAAAVSAAVLRYDCVAAEDRLYESRLAGADAVLVPVALADGELPRLVALARALHVAVVAEVATRAERDAAVAAGAPVIALAPGCLALASEIPTRYPLIVREPIDAGRDLALVHGRADAALVEMPLAAGVVARAQALVDAAAALSR